MSDKVYDVPAEWAKRAWVNAAKYEEMYKRSITDPEGFWAEHGKRIDWFTPFTKVKNTSFDAHNVSIKWFEDGVTNVAHNCIDRHLPKRANQTAIIWEGDDPSKSKHITYAELADRVGRFANVLKGRGVKKGDRVTIYLPMIPEAAYAMLACARIGAIHSVVFGGFSPDALAGRIADAKSEVVITADEGLRGGRKVPLKANVDAAIEKAGGVKTVIVVRHTGGDVGMAARARRLAARSRADGDRGLSGRADERGGPAVHPLHVRLDRRAQGRRAHHRRLSRLCLDDPPICVRLSRGRHLLVHRRRRMGDRPQLHSLRAPGQWRDHAHVRGHSELSLDQPVLGSHRQAQGQYLLHRADRDPLAHGRGRGAGQEDQPRLAASSGFGRRADQSGGLGMVPPRRRRQPLPGRRHLVADRDRRHSHLPVARRDEAQGRVGDQPVLRRHSRDRRRRGQCSEAARARATWSSPTRGPASRAPSSATTRDS